MRILMTESDPRAAAEVAARLTEAGHQVVSCTDAPNRPFPCRGVAGEACPLDEGVAVACSVPGQIPPEPRAGGVGLICALRRHIPLLVVAPDDAAWSDAPFAVVPMSKVVEEVERAAGAALAVHTDLARAEIRRDLGPTADASVVRTGTGVTATLTVPPGTEAAQVESAAIRVKAAIRRADPWATVIDVRAEEG
jgi:hypothetical protein